jgi:hypothetical protein
VDASRALAGRGEMLSEDDCGRFNRRGNAIPAEELLPVAHRILAAALALGPAPASQRPGRVDQPVPAPADTSEPGMRPGDFRFVFRARDNPRHCRLPTVEPARRRSRVEHDGERSPGRSPEALQKMMTRVQQDVGDRIPHLTRRPQDAEMVAAIEDRPRQGKGALDRTREPGPDRFHPTGERAPARGLYEQMHVVRLDRVVQHAEVAPFATSPERAA